MSPFKLPAFLSDGGYLCAADSELICLLESATPEEAAFILRAVNAHDILVNTLEIISHGWDAEYRVMAQNALNEAAQ